MRKCAVYEVRSDRIYPIKPPSTHTTTENQTIEEPIDTSSLEENGILMSEEDYAILRLAEESFKEDWESKEDEYWDDY